jgi:hypothetical protein
MAKEAHIKTDKNPLSAGVLGSYDISNITTKDGIHGSTKVKDYRLTPVASFRGM